MVLSAINQYPTKAYAGLLRGLDNGYDVRSYVNNAGDTAGVYDLVITAAGSSHNYTATIYGINVLANSSSGTASVVRDAIIAAIVAMPALVALVSAVASGNNVRITELNPENGPAGITGLDGDLALTVVTAHSNLEPMPAGILVYHGAGFQDLRLPRAAPSGLASGSIAGVTMHQHAPINERLFPAPSAVNFPANKVLPVLKRGQIYVVTEVQCALTDTPYFRFAAGAGGSQLGAFRNDNDSSTAASLAASVSVSARFCEIISATLACLDFNLLVG